MSHDEMLNALKNLQVETGSLVCLGCGYEHSCSIHGCAILRAAVDELERLKTLESAKSVTIQIKPCPIDEEVINFTVRRIIKEFRSKNYPTITIIKGATTLGEE